MGTQIQRRRGTTLQHASFAGALGEITVDTDKSALVVHDGVTVGGFTGGGAKHSDTNSRKRSQEDKNTDFITVADWGFDNTAIQNAVTYWRSLSRGILRFTPGVYTLSSEIAFKMASEGAHAIEIQPGAIINHSGSAFAINADGNGEAYAGVQIYGGGHIIGTSSGSGAIRLSAFNRGLIMGLYIKGYTNGDGILISGANTIDILSCDIRTCINGIRGIGSVVSSVSYGAIGIQVLGGHISNNSGWGIKLENSGVGEQAQSWIIKTVFDPNGSNNATSGHIWIQQATSILINSHMEYGSSQYGEASIKIGDASNQPVGVVIHGCLIGGVNATHSINDNGNGTIIEGNTETAAVTNFIFGGSASVRRMIGKNLAFAASNMFAGTDNGDTIDIGSNTGLNNSIQASATGLAFKSITGNGLVLPIRARDAGDTRIVDFNNYGGSRVASVNTSGGFVPGAPDGTAQSNGIYMGIGVPSNANGADNDYYFRLDTVSIVNQRLYVKISGTWTGIL